MKKIILIFICVFMSHILYAQSINRDFASFNHRIDSLTLVYSVEQWKKLYRVWFYFNDSNLNDTEKEHLIAKASKLFEQKEYVNLYRLGHKMIYDMWNMYPNNNSLEIKQMLMELYLQYYFYPGADQIIISYDLDAKSYYTKKAKKRIIEILEHKKTKEEFEAYLKYESSFPGYTSDSWENAARVMKKREIQNAEVLKQIKDSLFNESVLRNAKEGFESLQIENELIKIIGLLDMKECIPVLKQNLLSCPEEEYQIRERAYRYALARLGDKEQRQYILDNFMDMTLFNKRDFAYFRDDEMIWRYIDVNYSSGKEISHLPDFSLPADLMTIHNIYPYIKNVPKDVEYPKANTFEEISEWSKIFYQWLMKNKGNVKFDYDGEKNWSFWR